MLAKLESMCNNYQELESTIIANSPSEQVIGGTREVKGWISGYFHGIDKAIPENGDERSIRSRRN